MRQRVRERANTTNTNRESHCHRPNHQFAAICPRAPGTTTPPSFTTATTKMNTTTNNNGRLTYCCRECVLRNLRLYSIELLKWDAVLGDSWCWLDRKDLFFVGNSDDATRWTVGKISSVCLSGRCQPDDVIDELELKPVCLSVGTCPSSL